MSLCRYAPFALLLVPLISNFSNAKIHGTRHYRRSRSGKAYPRRL